MKSSQQKVSVIIPVFNKELWVRKTLESVFRQTHSNLEIIIVDDGSTDSSLDEILKFREGIEPVGGLQSREILVFTQSNLGQTAARQFGAKKASGDFLAFLDADDYWHPGKISRQLTFFEKNPSKQVVLSNYLVVNKEGKLRRAVNFSPLGSKLRDWLMTTGSGGLIESTGLIRKQYFIRSGGFSTEITMGSGLQFTYNTFNDGDLGLVEEYLCVYRLLEDGWHSNLDDLVFSQDKIIPILFKGEPALQRKALNFLQEYVYWQKLRRSQEGVLFYLLAPLAVIIRGHWSVYFLYKIWIRITRECIVALLISPSKPIRQFIKLAHNSI